MSLRPETKLRRALVRLLNTLDDYSNERHFGAGGGMDGDDDMAETPEARAVDKAVANAHRVLAATAPPKRDAPKRQLNQPTKET